MEKVISKGFFVKLKVWTEESKKSDEHQLFLRLFDNASGIILRIVNKEGEGIESGNVLIYDNDLRCFVLLDGLSDYCPIKTDHRSSPIVIKKSERNKLIQEEMPEFIMEKIMENLKQKEKEESVHH